MSRPDLRVLLDLTGPSCGCDLLHLRGLLPDLLAQRPGDSVDLLARPHLVAELREDPSFEGVLSRGVRSNRSALRSGAVLAAGSSSYDVVLRPLSREPVPSRSPQIVWDWHADSACLRPGSARRARAVLARQTLGRTGLVVYPTAAARYDAEGEGRTGPGLVVPPPVWGGGRPPTSGVTASHDARSALRVAVPVDRRTGQNVALVPRVSAVLTGRGVDHRFVVGGVLPSGMSSDRITGGLATRMRDRGSLRGVADAVMLPASQGSCAAMLSLVEHWGLPVVASATASHREVRRRAQLFDPASPHGAADALLAVSRTERRDDSTVAGPPVTAASDYASVISSEMDRLSAGEGLPWAV